MFIDDQNIIESFLAVDKHLNETGVRPIESYVVDDGWNQYRKSADQYLTGDDLRRNGSVDGKDGLNHEGFWQFNNKFPDGLTPSSNLVQKLGSDFGVWIGRVAATTTRATWPASSPMPEMALLPVAHRCRRPALRNQVQGHGRQVDEGLRR